MTILFVGTEISHNNVQLLEIVLLTTKDNYELCNISPTIVIKRNIDISMDPDRYKLYSINGLLDEADLSATKESWAEDRLIELLPPKINVTPLVFFSQEDVNVVKSRMPVLSSRLTGKIQFAPKSKYVHYGRALEDTISAISQMKNSHKGNPMNNG